MASMRELFKSDLGGLLGTKGLYGKSRIYIETQGVIFPPRLKALALSSPNGIADLAGITIAALFGIRIASANRPSDTIFNNNSILAKPLIGLAGPIAQRNTGIVNPTKAYYIKQTPAPYQVVNQIKAGLTTNPLGTLLTAAKNELRDGTIREIFAKRTAIEDKFGTKNQHTANRSKPLAEDRKFSEYYPVYGEETPGIIPLVPQIFKRKDKKSLKNVQNAVQPRESSKLLNGYSKWDQINNELLEGKFKTIDELEKPAKNGNVNIPYVAFQLYGKTGPDAYILLPGTVSGLSEDVQPSWNTYKYIGSPFNTYRYSGVERSIKFDLKLYATGKESLENMKKNLNKLRETTFPNREVSTIEYKSDTLISGYNPNLLYLTVSGYYKNLFGFIDSLGITVEDNTTWSVDQIDTSDFDGVKEKSHPSVINVSISMKIIEQVHNESIEQLAYYFTDSWSESDKILGDKAAGAKLSGEINALKDKIKGALPQTKPLDIKSFTQPKISKPSLFKSKIP
jgi:hypothetical protein